ncbi:hypothetical protein [Sphingobacterium daejeonense]|uniref:hypothetical protein n=1 Tax=Sphingobacterium daejeonense TaxID=371142 RepID=UPI0010C24C82|nr:hypothetical protein [Sphingobacterium daejeonense]VTP89603.1 Uncharacterised protein [Sphingobacterium daejeonense]
MDKNLITDNPIAIQALMTDTVFAIPDSNMPIVETQSLGNTTTPQQGHLESSAEEFVYKGDRTTGVLFILRYPDYPYFSPQAEEAFLKTIGALQLNAENVAILNLANPHNPNEWKRIMSFFNPKKITLLGVDPTSLRLPEIAHNSYMHGKVATVFNTFSFEEMFADVQKKKLFWTEFKSFIQS